MLLISRVVRVSRRYHRAILGSLQAPVLQTSKPAGFEPDSDQWGFLSILVTARYSFPSLHSL